MGAIKRLIEDKKEIQEEIELLEVREEQVKKELAKLKRERVVKIQMLIKINDTLIGG